MNRIKFGVLMCSFFFVLLAATPVFAHGGSLDSNGCHHDRQNGGYHCHPIIDYDSFYVSEKQVVREAEYYRFDQDDVDFIDWFADKYDLSYDSAKRHYYLAIVYGEGNYKHHILKIFPKDVTDQAFQDIADFAGIETLAEQKEKRMNIVISSIVVILVIGVVIYHNKTKKKGK